MFAISTLQFPLFQSLEQKIKILKFEIKFCILGLEFKNTIVIFDSALEFVFSLSLVQKKNKQKTLNLGPTISYLGLLRLVFEIRNIEFV